MIVLAEMVIGAWLGLGAFLAIYGALTEDLSKFPFVHRVGIILTTVLLWPAAYLPEKRSDDNSLVATMVRKRRSASVISLSPTPPPRSPFKPPRKHDIEAPATAPPAKGRAYGCDREAIEAKAPNVPR